MMSIRVFCLLGTMLLIVSTVQAAPSNRQYSDRELDTASTNQLRVLAEKGNAEAQYRLGNIYDCTQHSVKDCKEAVRLLRLAAMQGHAQAQFRLGFLLSIGVPDGGVPKNLKDGLKWMQLAAAQGIPMAQFNVAYAYHDGLGTVQNYAEAMRWSKLAAKQGLPNAQVYLGRMYEKGEGGPQDYVRAHMWFNLAAAQGYKGTDLLHDDPAILRDSVAKEMTAAQIAEAQSMASRCDSSQYRNCD